MVQVCWDTRSLEVCRSAGTHQVTGGGADLLEHTRLLEVLYVDHRNSSHVYMGKYLSQTNIKIQIRMRPSAYGHANTCIPDI